MAKDSQNEIIAVDVFLERRKSRERVGRLTRARVEGKPLFEFKYSEDYLLKGRGIPLGPEFPLTQVKFQSKKLFPSFEDRIPSRENPAYEDYCRQVGISSDETNPMVLLSTLGRKGPSSFVFEGVKQESNAAHNVAEYRQRLGLTIREFASIFGASAASIQKLEHGKSAGRELTKRLSIYMIFPEVALWEAMNNRAKIHDEKYQALMRKLKERKND